MQLVAPAHRAAHASLQTRPTSVAARIIADAASAADKPSLLGRVRGTSDTDPPTGRRGSIAIPGDRVESGVDGRRELQYVLVLYATAVARFWGSARRLTTFDDTSVPLLPKLLNSQCLGGENRHETSLEPVEKPTTSAWIRQAATSWASGSGVGPFQDRWSRRSGFSDRRRGGSG